MKVVRLSSDDDVGRALGSIGLARPRPAIVVVGGAGGLDATALARLQPLFVRGIAPAAERMDAVVVDGGTDAGVMRLVGAARAAVGGTFPLIGVVAENTVDLPGNHSPEDAPRVEPHHTHLVVVPGDDWGDEGPWIARIAGALSDGRGSVTVLVNGGEIALADVEHSVAAGRRVVVVGDSGRAAQELDAAIRRDSRDGRAGALAASGLVTSVHGLDDERDLVAAIEAALGDGS